MPTLTSTNFALAVSLHLLSSHYGSLWPRLVAHPLGAVQRIWSPALAMAICVCWRGEKCPLVCAPIRSLSHCSRPRVWTAVIWCQPSYVWPRSLVSAHTCITLQMMKTGQRDEYIFGDLKWVRHKQVLFLCLSAQLGWRDTGNILLILWANPFRRTSNPSKHGAHHNTSQCTTLSNHDSLQYEIKIWFSFIYLCIFPSFLFYFIWRFWRFEVFFFGEENDCLIGSKGCSLHRWKAFMEEHSVHLEPWKSSKPHK